MREFQGYIYFTEYCQLIYITAGIILILTEARYKKKEIYWCRERGHAGLLANSVVKESEWNINMINIYLLEFY